MHWLTENSDPLTQPPVTLMGAPFAPDQVSRWALAEGDAGVQQTIALMYRMVDDAVKDPVVNRTAVELLRGVPEWNPQADAQAIFDFVHQNFRFVNDPIGPSGGTQALRPVRELLKLRAGNCANFSILVASLAGTVGYRVRFVTVAHDSADPNQFSHIYPEIEVGGQWIACDAARPGAQLGRRPEVSYRAPQVWESGSGGVDFPISGMRKVLNGLACCPADEGRAFANSLPMNYRAAMAGYQMRTPHRSSQRGRGMGDVTDSTLAQDIQASTTGVAQIIAAGNPNSYVYGSLTSGTGQVAPLYLPGGLNNTNPFGTSLVSPLGSATISPMLMLLGIGLFAVLLIKK
jgi:hypothetical protein